MYAVHVYLMCHHACAQLCEALAMCTATHERLGADSALNLLLFFNDLMYAQL
jgi:hypothetical protein